MNDGGVLGACLELPLGAMRSHGWDVVPSAGAFASHEVKDATELAVGVSSAGFELDRGRRRHLL